MEGLADKIGVPERKKTSKGAEVIFEERMTSFSKIDNLQATNVKKIYVPKHSKRKENLSTL